MKFWSLMIILLVSCKETSIPKYSIKDSYISNDLYDKIIDYQKKFPLPIYQKPNNNGFAKNQQIAKYIYEIYIYVEKKDTIISILLNDEGIHNLYGKKYLRSEVNGIYKDSTLNETYILDPKRLGRSFVKKYIVNKIEIDKYITEDSSNDGGYGIYNYKIRGKKLVLDTIYLGNINKKFR